MVARLGMRVLYAPSDAFQTFPRPAETEPLNRVGQTLDVERREVMLRRSLGVTDLYNLINNPQIAGADVDVARMCAIHVELDYGGRCVWLADIPLEHGFHTYKQVERWTVSPAARVEILDRLLEENHRRAAAEEGAAAAVKSKRKQKKAMAGHEEALF